MCADFIVHIPETGYQRLLTFLDKEFPHCIACNSRFDLTAPDTLAGSGVCPDCVANAELPGGT